MSIRLSIAVLFVSCCLAFSLSAQKNVPQNGLYLTIGNGLGTVNENLNSFKFQNGYAWNVAQGYHANLGNNLALRVSLGYERATAERYDVRSELPEVLTEFQLHERKFTMFRLMVSPVFYINKNRWQFNFLPTLGLAKSKNLYNVHYGVDYHQEDYRDINFTQTPVDLNEGYFGVSPAVSVAYQVTKSKTFKSWLELGLQPSWWFAVGTAQGYEGDYKSYMLQLSYMISLR